MLAQDLANELNQGFQSALASTKAPFLTREEVESLLRSCANNAAQAYADRTLSEEMAERFAKFNDAAGVTIDLESWVKDELFEAEQQL